MPPGIISARLRRVMYAPKRQALYFRKGFRLIKVMSCLYKDWPEMSSQDAYFVENTDENDNRSIDCFQTQEIWFEVEILSQCHGDISR